MAESQSLLGQSVSYYLEKLGGCGIGVRHKAEYTGLHRCVALRFLSDQVAKDRRAISQLKRRTQTASAFNNANISAIQDMGEAEGRVFIAMQKRKSRSS